MRNSFRALAVVIAPTISRSRLSARATAPAASSTIAGSVARPSKGPRYGHGPSVSSSLLSSGTILASHVASSVGDFRCERNEIARIEDSAGGRIVGLVPMKNRHPHAGLLDNPERLARAVVRRMYDHRQISFDRGARASLQDPPCPRDKARIAGPVAIPGHPDLAHGA